MAKYVCDIRGDFDDFCRYLQNALMKSSFSASIEEEDYFEIEDIKIGNIVFERFSYTGSNRVSLSVNIVAHHENIHITAFSTGGSQAVFFKINTFGENAFLDKLIEAIDAYHQ